MCFCAVVRIVTVLNCLLDYQLGVVQQAILLPLLCILIDPFHMDPFQSGSNPGSTHFAPFIHATANRVETGLDNRVRPTSEVGFDPVVSELEVS